MPLKNFSWSNLLSPHHSFSENDPSCVDHWIVTILTSGVFNLNTDTLHCPAFPWTVFLHSFYPYAVCFLRSNLSLSNQNIDWSCIFFYQLKQSMIFDYIYFLYIKKIERKIFLVLFLKVIFLSLVIYFVSFFPLLLLFFFQIARHFFFYCQDCSKFFSIVFSLCFYTACRLCLKR